MQRDMYDIMITAKDLGYKKTAEVHNKGGSDYCFVNPETDEGFLVQINRTLGVCFWTYHLEAGTVLKSGEVLNQLKEHLKITDELMERRKIRGICKSCHKEKEVDSNGHCFDC